MEVMIMKNLGHVKALNRWEFEMVGKNEYATVIDGLKIMWNEETQSGAYTNQSCELELIHNWNELDDIMELTSIY